MSRYASLMFAAWLAGMAGSAQALKLIGEEEARQPAASGTLVTRGITRGPGIRLISPDPAAGPIRGPFPLKLAFEPRGGARIDPASVRLTYLKAQPIELIDRVRVGLSENGIDIESAEIPPGQHPLQISVADTAGRKTSLIVQLTAQP